MRPKTWMTGTTSDHQAMPWENAATKMSVWPNGLLLIKSLKEECTQACLKHVTTKTKSNECK